MLTEICSYHNYIPTGSPISQLIAFWAYKNTFDQIEEIAIKNNMQFSTYVDDITFSCNKVISPRFHLYINYILKQVVS